MEIRPAIVVDVKTPTERSPRMKVRIMMGRVEPILAESVENLAVDGLVVVYGQIWGILVGINSPDTELGQVLLH